MSLQEAYFPKEGLFDDWIVYSGGDGVIGAAASFGKLALDLRRRKFDAVFYLMTRNRSLGRIKRDRLFFQTAGIKSCHRIRFSC